MRPAAGWLGRGSHSKRCAGRSPRGDQRAASEGLSRYAAICYQPRLAMGGDGRTVALVAAAKPLPQPRRRSFLPPLTHARSLRTNPLPTGLRTARAAHQRPTAEAELIKTGGVFAVDRYSSPSTTAPGGLRSAPPSAGWVPPHLSAPAVGCDVTLPLLPDGRCRLPFKIGGRG